MDENNEKKSELKKGLFGETDRVNGEYHFKSGDVEKIYSDAHVVPYGDDPVPPKFYQPDFKKTKKRKKGIGFAGVIILCLSCALLGGFLGAGLMTAYFDRRVGEVENSVRSISTASAENAETESEENLISAAAVESTSSAQLSSEEIYDLACKQVVSISTEYVGAYNTLGQVTGSGIVGSEDGLILTNFHVVEKAYYGNYGVTVSFMDGTCYDGQVVAADVANDLAIVKISAEGLSPATFATDAQIAGGTEITIAGNPYGLFNVSSGKISNPSIDVDADDNGNVINMFQMDVSVYEGNSGGPVYNRNGEVIGIVTAKVSVDSSDGIGFAIPVSTVSDLYYQVINYGYVQPASLGVTYFQDYDVMFRTYYNCPEGAFVEEVQSGSCADKAGIMVGDVILEIDGQRVENYSQAENIIARYQSGEEVNIIISRDNLTYTADVTLD